MSFWEDLVWEFEGSPQVKIISYTQSLVEELNIPQKSKEFLLSYGLIDSTAPCMNFHEIKDSGWESLNTQWGLTEVYDNDIVLGSVSGNSVTIKNDSTGIIQTYDHDNNFKPMFMNSSVEQLAECIKINSVLIRKTQEENGEEAYCDNDIPDHLQEWIACSINEVDSAAFEENSFWWWIVEGYKDGKYEDTVPSPSKSTIPIKEEYQSYADFLFQGDWQNREKELDDYSESEENIEVEPEVEEPDSVSLQSHTESKKPWWKFW